MRPTQALFRARRRMPLTTKMVNGGFYKGNRTGSMGKINKHGQFKVDWAKVRTYVVPADLADYKMSPFVTKKIIVAPEDRFKRMTAQEYIEKWKEENGTD